MLKNIFKPTPIVDERYEFYLRMRTALNEYTNALAIYNSMKRELEEPSTIVNIAFATVEHHRVHYYELRIQYEEMYGDKEYYQDSLSRLDTWASSAGMKLLIRPLTNPFLCKRH